MKNIAQAVNGAGKSTLVLLDELGSGTDPQEGTALAMSVLDELIDRFGDVPEAVKGLINIALLRSRAEKLGIYEIKQQPDYLLLYVRQLKCEAVADIIGRFPGRAMLSAASKPYIAVRLKKNENIRKLINEIVFPGNAGIV